MPNNFALFFFYPEKNCNLQRLPKGDNVSVGRDAKLAFQKAKWTYAGPKGWHWGHACLGKVCDDV